MKRAKKKNKEKKIMITKKSNQPSYDMCHVLVRFN